MCRLFLKIIISISLLCTSCIVEQKISNQSIVENLDVISVSENWERANAIAQRWDDGAYLDYFWVDVPLPNSKRGVVRDINFDFQTKNNDKASLMVSCNNFHCKEIPFEQEVSVIEANSFQWKNDYIDAEEILLISLDYLDWKNLYRSNSTLRLIMNIFSDFSENPVWRVLYYDHTNNEVIDLLFDPESGELLSKKISGP